eukprot:g7911.t1
MYDVGEKVRVAIGPGKTCRALVMCVGSSDDGKPTYDVLLQPPDSRATAAAAASSATSTSDKHGEGHSSEEASAVDAVADGRELTALPASDISPLQPFELEDSEDSCPGEEVSQAAERLKDRGNALFKLGDTDAAAEMFTRVLRTLEPKPVVGATVLVRLAPSDAASATRFRSGIISDADDNGGSPTFDVIYDEAENNADQQGAGTGREAEEEDEEDGVAADRVLGVPASPCVWCAARLNLARCSFRGGRHAEVVEACTFVLVVARLTMAEKERPREERAKLRNHCLTALRMRGGSHLAQHHVGLARKDARSMLRSSGDNEESRAQATRFEAEVERKAKALLKANRKLAKDVTRWVDASMAKHEEASLKGDASSGGEALPAPPARPGRGGGGGGVEESKGGDRSAGDWAEGGAKSWLGGWIR